MKNFFKNTSVRSKVGFFALLISGPTLILIGKNTNEAGAIYIGIFNLLFLLFFLFLIKKTTLKTENGYLKNIDIFSTKIEVSKIKNIQIKCSRNIKNHTIFVLTITNLDEKTFDIDISHLSKEYTINIIKEIMYQNSKINLISKDSNLLSITPENIEKIVEEAHDEALKLKII